MILFITSGWQPAKRHSGPGFHCKESSRPQNSLWNWTWSPALAARWNADFPPQAIPSHSPPPKVDSDNSLKRIPHHLLSGKWKKSSPETFSGPLAFLIDCEFNIFLTQFKYFSLKRLLLFFLVCVVWVVVSGVWLRVCWHIFWARLFEKYWHFL